MKTLVHRSRWPMLLLAGTLLLTLSTALVRPAPASAAGVPNDIPATAAPIAGQSQTIAGNASLWYRFDYGPTQDDGEKQGAPVTVTLVNGTNSGLTFNVYTPDQINSWWDGAPIGRGTAQAVDEEGIPVDNGPYQSADLTWVGRFPVGGTYYVLVTNTNPDARAFTLTIQGDDVIQPGP